MTAGWIKAHRQMRESPMLQSAVRKGVWLDLLLMAAHQPARVSLRGRVVDLQSGQCAIVMGDWAKTLGLTPRQLERIMDSFVSESAVSKSAGPGKAYTVLTITKYAEFQSLAEARGERAGEAAGKGRGKGGEREQEPEESKEDIYSVAQLPLAAVEPEAQKLKPKARRKEYPQADKLPQNGSGKHYPDKFEELWQAYPKQATDTKPGCYNHWARHMNDHKADADEIIRAAKRYAREKGADPYRLGLLRWCREGLWTVSEVAEPTKARTHDPMAFGVYGPAQ